MNHNLKYRVAFVLSSFISISAFANSPKPVRDSIDLVAESTFTQGVEGPVVGPHGYLYAVNFSKQGTIGKIDSKGSAQLYVALPEGSTGNGLQFSPSGLLYVADYTGHNILMVDPKTKSVSVHAHNAEMNQPNDIAMMSDGTLFASDPNWSKGNGQLWRISPDGQTQRMAENLGTTNGIAISPNEKILYVNESVQRKVWAYDLDKNHNISNKRLLIEFNEHGLDGMRCDKLGNLYIARYGAGVVLKVTPQGRVIKEFRLKGLFPTNVALSNDQSRLYVTMQKRGSVEYLVLN
ncbi:SMP-30/gluconolactonase/LRE family protein [Psychrobium sp. 1_MG-2023]|uniref:SMP-30/gluconolactonase/LRE family protein n=1 Tax=Psychrobium sp. 1_MG-2023 TaxID=3062624 RepID=UPI000C32D4D3|nr:SMP-30/gluconolactonase/LRE family protein [Psychrobium sp. 1_MG-2023]MDP2560224.1 SMP-30/gluconolactonase/LRE family protein [Psychrobium sp. 1_MG-2023]PKF57034.1 gluconolactonase [Alteromonadales bacterium alter-6D02]